MFVTQHVSTKYKTTMSSSY